MFLLDFIGLFKIDLCQFGQAAVTIASTLPWSGELSLPLANEQRLLPPSATGNHAQIGITREVLPHVSRKMKTIDWKRQAFQQTLRKRRSKQICISWTFWLKDSASTQRIRVATFWPRLSQCNMPINRLCKNQGAACPDGEGGIAQLDKVPAISAWRLSGFHLKIHHIHL